MDDKPIRILLVEDEHEYARLMRRMLASVKKIVPVTPRFDLEWVDQLSTGVERLSTGGIDAILLDLILPDSQGLDTFVSVHAQVPRVPIIVLTNLDDEALAIKAVQQGAQDYLVKGQVDGNLLVRATRYAIERKRAEEALRRYAERLTILHEIDRALLTARSLEAIADTALDRIRQLVDCQRAGVVVFDFETHEAIQLAIRVGDETRLGTGARIPLELSGSAEDLRRGKVHMVEDILSFPSTARLSSPKSGSRHHSQLPSVIQALHSEGMRSYISAPIIAHGELIGALNLGADNPGFFDSEHIAIAREVADSLATALQQARLHEQAERHADELAAVIDQLQEVDRFKNKFIQNISHELSAPLSLIQGYADMLAAGKLGELRPQQQQPVASIARRTRILSEMVQDIMLLLKAEASPPNPEPTQLDKLAQAAVEDFQIAVEKSKLTLRAEIAPPLPPVSGYPAYLRRVVDNLLGNAVKFTPAGGTITVRMWQEGERVVLEVSDSGVGIPSDQLGRIFERFYQVKEPARRKRGGIGLGLALVKEIVETYGGEVTVESEVGQGSTFMVTLPISKE